MYVDLREASVCAVTSVLGVEAEKNGYRFEFWSTTPIFQHFATKLSRKRPKLAPPGLQALAAAPRHPIRHSYRVAGIGHACFVHHGRATTTDWWGDFRPGRPLAPPLALAPQRPLTRNVPRGPRRNPVERAATSPSHAPQSCSPSLVQHFEFGLINHL